MTRFSWLCASKRVLFCALLLVVAAVADAGTIEIQFEGLNLDYDGTDIFDSPNMAGGNGDPDESDPLVSMTFLVDDVVVGSVLTADIFADILINDVEEIPVDGGDVTSGGGSYFDLLTMDSTPGWGLSLSLGEVQVFYSGDEIFILGGGVASSLVFQNLPFDLEINPAQQITITFVSASLDDITDDDDFLTGFKFSGTGNVRGRLIPEPATASLAMMGAFVLPMLLARRR